MFYHTLSSLVTTQSVIKPGTIVLFLALTSFFPHLKNLTISLQSPTLFLFLFIFLTQKQSQQKKPTVFLK